MSGRSASAADRVRKVVHGAPPPPPRPVGAEADTSRPGRGRGVGGGAVSRRRLAAFTLVIIGAFCAVALQLGRLGLISQDRPSLSVARAGERSFARPDIVDRQGRVLATDIVSPGLFADPLHVTDPDAVALELANHIDGLDIERLRGELADRSRRFVWIRRGLTPAKAQEIHDLGLPGLAFRPELRRVYPAGRFAAHVLGTVSIDNLGTLAIERHIDQTVGIDAVEPPGRSPKAPVALSLDLAAQHALRSELELAMAENQAVAAAGLVLDATTGEVVAMSSLPDFDPNHSGGALVPEAIDRLTRERFELGSVLKLVTVAAVLDGSHGGLETFYDASAPIEIAGRVIRDDHPQNRPLTLQEVFLKSSNIGAARMAEAVGPEALRDFMDRIGLLRPLTSELGAMAEPLPPVRWDDLHAMTSAYGHGIALAPMHFAAVAGTLLNGGHPIYPTFLKVPEGRIDYRARPVISPETSARLRALMRLNVTSPQGTGRRADVPGLDVGGKTGTAEIPTPEGYSKERVIASFVGAFPAHEPRYITYVMLFEPKHTDANGASRGGGRTAAPATARLISRLAPILGVTPRPLMADF
ncbi:MAG: penicillin-binding protein 2 [Rhizobiales bacterium]|nr:penicillin-binding protein 2 [Hyphomicrobiales bacterium]